MLYLASSVSRTNTLYSTFLIYLDYFVTYDKADTKLAAKTFNIRPLVSLDHCASSQDFDLTFIYLYVPCGKYNYNIFKPVWS